MLWVDASARDRRVPFSELAPIVFAWAAAMRADQPGDILFVGRSFAVLNERLALGTKPPARSADLKGLIETESIVQELEADAASAVLMGWHGRVLRWARWASALKPSGTGRDAQPLQIKLLRADAGGANAASS
jgi:hypothetical protein